eukprot:7009832-Prymnesium_polylepis.1
MRTARGYLTYGRYCNTRPLAQEVRALQEHPPHPAPGRHSAARAAGEPSFDRLTGCKLTPEDERPHAHQSR